MTKEEKIAESFSRLGITLSSIQINQFIKYYELLVFWNRNVNLTTVTDFDDVLLRHFVDSASVSEAVDFSSVDNVIDVGTGAGFPGMVLKILYPDLRITLLDSKNKKISFLNTVISELKLGDIDTVYSRAEDAAHNPAYREQYDLCLSRAVADLTVLSEYCLPFVKDDGLFIAYKSDNSDEEIKNANYALKTLSSSVDSVDKVVLSGSDIRRSLIIIKKISSINSKYPRKAGIPRKRPLVNTAAD